MNIIDAANQGDNGFKFKLDQTVYFLRHNAVASGRVVSRIRVDKTEGYVNDEAKRLKDNFGEARVEYATTAGVTAEDKTFASKADLLASL